MTLGEKIREAIGNAVARLEKLFGDAKPYHIEAIILKDCREAQRLWDEALKAAAENLKGGESTVKAEEQKENAAEKGDAELGNNTTHIMVLSMQDNPVVYDFGVTQDEIDQYVNDAYNLANKQDYKKYKKVSLRLISDVADKIKDIPEYTHALRDNDIRHIRNSHGEETNEKYPVTAEDQKLIPFIVENYDKVIVKENKSHEKGIVYVKATEENIIYYLEAVTAKYGDEKLLINKQLVKSGISNIPNLVGLIEAIKKEQTETEFLADLEEARKAYVRNVYQFQSDNTIIRNASENSNHQNEKSSADKEKEFSLSVTDSEGRTISQGQQEYFKDSKVRDEEGRLLEVYHGTDADFTVFDRTKGRTNMDINGFFFSPWELDAEGYGSKVNAYYLNITNPAPESLCYKALNRFKGQNGAGIKAREYLEALGYDGVNNGNEEYIAFRPEQIKLTSNRKPTSDPDTRFSKADSGRRLTLEEGKAAEANRVRLAAKKVPSLLFLRHILRNKKYLSVNKTESAFVCCGVSNS